MSLFKKLTRQEEPPEVREEERHEDEIPVGELNVGAAQREEFLKHLDTPEDEFWCRACNRYFSEETDVIAHMETEEHIKTEAAWKQDNPEDVYPVPRHRNGKPSRKLLKMRAAKDRKRLRRQGLLPEAKTGQSAVAKVRVGRRHNTDRYLAERRHRMRGGRSSEKPQ